MKSKQKIVSIIIAFIILLFANISLGAGTATITVETARLRESPSQNASILELISLNEEVEVLGQEGEWYQVRYNGITGYLRNDLLKVTNQNTDNTNAGTNEGNTQNTDNTADTSNTTTNETTSNEINNNVRVIGIAQNGLETIQKIADNEIDIILLDLIDKKPNIKTIINTIINKIEMKGG